MRTSKYLCSCLYFHLLFLLLDCCYGIVNESCQSCNASRDQDTFMNGFCYDKWTRPRNGSQPLAIFVRMYIYSLGAIEAHNLVAHMLVTYRWKDERLQRNGSMVEGEGTLQNKVWTPHLYIVNEQDSKIMGSGQDVLLTINGDGTVIYSTRMQVTLLCLMNLRKFPFDYQLCPLVLESWGYNNNHLTLEWEDTSPVTISSELELTEYTLAGKWTNKSITRYSVSRYHQKQDTFRGKFNGNFSSLTVQFRFEREIGHYIMDYYVPSILLVVVSWVSFWLDPNAVPGRTTLGTSTMLTFITLSRNIGSSLPKVSYIKATEIWFIVCTAFIFGSLVEFAFVNTIWRRRNNVELKKVNSKYILRSTLTPQPTRRETSFVERSESFVSLDESQIYNSLPALKFNNQLTVSSQASISKDPLPFSTQPEDPPDSNPPPSKGFFTMTPQEIAQWIDRRSRLVFPCSFIFFNCLYWIFVYIEL